MTYGALTAARLGLRVRALIGVDEQAAAAGELKLLRREGVELALARLARGPVMENRETAGGRLQLIGQASNPLEPEALPAGWHESQAVLLAPVAGELPAAWARVFPATALIGLAWQGVFRRLVAGRPMLRLPLRRSPLITRAGLALVGANDIAAAGPPLTELLSRPGQQLVVSHGRRGALHAVRRRGRLQWRRVPAIASGRPADETGAGDVFLATWFAAHLAAGDEDRRGSWPALQVAAAAASLSVQASTLAELPDLGSIRRLLADRSRRAERGGSG